jgi:NADH:ubiquinone oxidoreductase subunit D
MKKQKEEEKNSRMKLNLGPEHPSPLCRFGDLCFDQVFAAEHVIYALEVVGVLGDGVGTAGGSV